MPHGRGGSACAAVGEIGGHVEAGRGELDEGAQLCTGVADLRRKREEGGGGGGGGGGVGKSIGNSLRYQPSD